jgi:hypothetical protein
MQQRYQKIEMDGISWKQFKSLLCAVGESEIIVISGCDRVVKDRYYMILESTETVAQKIREAICAINDGKYCQIIGLSDEDIEEYL